MIPVEAEEAGNDADDAGVERAASCESQGLFLEFPDGDDSSKSDGSIAFMKRTKSLAKSQRFESKTTLSNFVAN